MGTSRGPQHRTLAYLGELNGSTESAWRKSIAVFNGEGAETQLERFSSDSPVVPSGERVVQVVLDRVRWERPRDFGEVFLARHRWHLLGLEELLESRMAPGAAQVPWPVMAFILTAARLIAPWIICSRTRRRSRRTSRRGSGRCSRSPSTSCSTT